MLSTSNSAPGPLDLVRLLVNTIEYPHGMEELDSVEQAAAWCRSHGLEPIASPEELVRLREFREALRALLIANNGEAEDAAAWKTMQPYLSSAWLHLGLEHGRGVVLEPWGQGVEHTIASLLVAVHEAINAGNWKRLRACRKSSCRYAFYDRSKNCVRTWCSTNVCGNQEKALRKRLRDRVQSRRHDAFRRASRPGNFPVQPAALIGRDEELAHIKTRLRKSRLVTLTGTAGVGKTHVALQVATELAHGYPGGVWFVDLAPITDSALVPSTIAKVFDVADDGSSRPLIQRLASTIKARERSLILLDNCEQVSAAVVEAIEDLLRLCPGLRVLATSRNSLGMSGEEAYRLPSLTVPPEGVRMTAKRVLQFGAAALFVARARSAQRGFILSDDNAGIVADIVRRLDGIPLAIELAAPRVNVLDFRQLPHRLDERFKGFSAEGRATLPRQQTMGVLIDWSYHLLSSEERAAFRRLAVFAGGFTLEAAAAILRDVSGESRDVQNVLMALVNKSIVSLDDRTGRFRLYESIRQYALQRLSEAGEHEEARRAHAELYENLGSTAAASFGTPGESEEVWFARYEPELDNFRAALDWALDADVHLAARMIGNLYEFLAAERPVRGRVAAQRSRARRAG